MLSVMWFWWHNHALVESRTAKSLTSLQLIRVLPGLMTILRVPLGFVWKRISRSYSAAQWEGPLGQRLPYFVCHCQVFENFWEIITEKKSWVLTFFIEIWREFWFSSGFIFSLWYVKISSFALPKKTAVSAQFFMVALTKATSLVRSFSHLCSYKVLAFLLNTDKDFKINFCTFCDFRSKDLVWWAVCCQISEFTLLASNPFNIFWRKYFL